MYFRRGSRASDDAGITPIPTNRAAHHGIDQFHLWNRVCPVAYRLSGEGRTANAVLFCGTYSYDGYEFSGNAYSPTGNAFGVGNPCWTFAVGFASAFW